MKAILSILVATPLLIHLEGSPTLNGWLMSLKSRAGMICCDGRDATVVDEAYTENGHWVAVVDGKKFEIPESSVVEQGNKFGQPLIWLRGGAVMCFLPGAGI